MTNKPAAPLSVQTIPSIRSALVSTHSLTKVSVLYAITHRDVQVIQLFGCNMSEKTSEQLCLFFGVELAVPVGTVACDTVLVRNSPVSPEQPAAPVYGVVTGGCVN